MDRACAANPDGRVLRESRRDRRDARAIGASTPWTPLCALQAPEGIDVIGRELLRPDSTELEREHYTHVLGEIGNYAAIEPLEAAAAQDPDRWVGRCAREAIERIPRGE